MNRIKSKNNGRGTFEINKVYVALMTKSIS